MSNLKSRASSHFEQYVDALLKNGETYLLPVERLSQSEWDELNREIASQGIKLIPREYNGAQYMQFLKIDKTKIFQQGAETLQQRQFEHIKQEYPNLSDETVREIIALNDSARTSDQVTVVLEDTIYKKLRYTKNPYAASASEFQDAAKYASQQTLDISTNGRQNWTWFRQVWQPANKDRAQFHISLNVNVTRDLLQKLDNILVEDGGNVIAAYKSPKAEYFHEVTNRHDPITIYLKKRDANIERKIVAAVAPYVRSNEGLLGEMLGAGVDINKETTDTHGTSVGMVAAIGIANYLDLSTRGLA